MLLPLAMESLCRGAGLVKIRTVRIDVQTLMQVLDVMETKCSDNERATISSTPINLGIDFHAIIRRMKHPVALHGIGEEIVDFKMMQRIHCRAYGKGGENQDAEDDRSDAGPSGPLDADNGNAFLETRE